MRLALGALVVIVLFIFFAYGDFFFSRVIKKKIKEINQEAKESFGFNPISKTNTLVFSAIFWIPFYYLTAVINILLEYKILLIIIHLLITSLLVFWHLSYRSSPRTAQQALPMILFFSIPYGVIILSCIALFRAYSGP